MGKQVNKPNFNDDKDSEGQAYANYAKYTGMAFQMMAIIGLCSFIGYQIDKYFQHQLQWATALGGVIGVCASIYQTIRQLKS